MESGNESGYNSTMSPLIIEDEMYAISSSDESDAEPISTDMLEGIFDGSQYHKSINRREEIYKIHDCIKWTQAEWKGGSLSIKNMGKCLHKVYKAFVNDISQVLQILGESVSKVPYFIPEPGNFAEVTRLSEDIKKPWLKATQKDIKNIINNQSFLVQESDKGGPVTP